MQPACISGPKLASGPVNGLKLAKVSVPVYVFGVADCVVEPQAATVTTNATATATRPFKGASHQVP